MGAARGWWVVRGASAEVLRWRPTSFTARGPATKADTNRSGVHRPRSSEEPKHEVGSHSRHFRPTWKSSTREQRPGGYILKRLHRLAPTMCATATAMITHLPPNFSSLLHSRLTPCRQVAPPRRSGAWSPTHRWASALRTTSPDASPPPPRPLPVRQRSCPSTWGTAIASPST